MELLFTKGFWAAIGFWTARMNFHGAALILGVVVGHFTVETFWP